MIKPSPILLSLTMPPKQALTSSNYYSNESDKQYLSATWFKKFMACEASALFELQNPTEIKSIPMIVGNYVHSYFESKEAHDKFVKANEKEIKTRSGTKRADFKKADRMIERLEDTELFNFIYNNPNNLKESIVTGELFGANWKGKIDSLNVEKGYFCDLKTTARIDNTFWHPEERMRVPWFDEYGYGLQMAAYKKLLQLKYHKPFNCYIFAVDKTDIPAVDAFQVDQQRFEDGMAKIEEYQPRLLQVLAGEIKPRRCGHCDYCKASYQPTAFKSIDDIGEI